MMLKNYKMLAAKCIKMNVAVCAHMNLLYHHQVSSHTHLYVHSLCVVVSEFCIVVGVHFVAC